MPGHNYKILFDRATDQYGFVTAADAEELGIHKTRLPDMYRRGVVDRVARGVYRFREVPVTELDPYMEAVLWPQGTRGVLSHATALDLHDLCDVNPAKIEITVPRAHRVTRAVPPTYVIHRRDLDARDRAYHEGIPIVTPRRAILDAIEAHLDPRLIDQALDTARRRGLVHRDALAELEATARARVAA